MKCIGCGVIIKNSRRRIYCNYFCSLAHRSRKINEKRSAEKRNEYWKDFKTNTSYNYVQTGMGVWRREIIP